MNEPLRPSELVTIVGENCVTLTAVMKSTLEGFDVYEIGGFGSYSLSSEGQVWIRGHHLADSPDVRAARSAQALALPQYTSLPNVPSSLPFGTTPPWSAADMERMLRDLGFGAGPKEFRPTQEEPKKQPSVSTSWWSRTVTKLK